MTVITPEATPVQGNTKAWFVLTVAAPATLDLSSEIGHASTIDVSCFLRDFNPEMSSNSGNSPGRLCTTVQLPVEGNTQFSPIEVRYVYDPQAATSTDDNKLRLAAVRGTEFYLVVRKGLDAQSVAGAAGQYTETWKFRAGRQNYVRSGTDEFSEYEISQQWFPLIEPVHGAIVA